MMILTASSTWLCLGATAPALPCCPVLELRQYTLHPGKRDVLIELFEREFIEPQEALGICIAGQFRDLDNPDRFVWLRGFPDMPTRARALNAFYTGPVWKAHRAAANATMIDSDNVLLLRPARANTGFNLGAKRAPAGAQQNPGGLLIATIYDFGAPVPPDFVAFFEREMQPALEEAGAPVLATFVTENSPNNFPALPVRENENVFVWFSAFAGADAHRAHLDRLSRSTPWQSASARLRAKLKADPQILRLSPTARSLLRG